MKLAVGLAVLAGAVPLCAQRVLFQNVGTSTAQLGAEVRPAGDVDTDGVPDFIATAPDDLGPSQLQVISGATGAVLLVIGGINPNHQGSLLDAVGIGDANGDGVSDIAEVTYGELKLFSGANGQLLWSRPPAAQYYSYVAVSEVGDFDGNGRADLAVATYSSNSGANEILVLSGVNGAQLTSIAPISNPQSEGILRPVGDLNGDGRMDLAFEVRDRVHVLTTVPPAIAWTIVPTPTGDYQRTLATVDLDGDGKREVLVGRPARQAVTGSQGQIDVFAGDTGLLLYSLMRPRGLDGIGPSACGIGDLDQDGVQDLACGSVNSPDFKVLAFSGRNGALLWSFASGPPLSNIGIALTDLGDVDHDGCHDVAVGCPYNDPGGGWMVLSGRVLADVSYLGGACGGGPFLPQLGMTRPILGANVTITCRDGAPGAWATLALSPQPTFPTYLGASSCTAHFDLGNWVVLYGAQQAAWSIQVPLPNVPQLAGLGVALQCFYSPTSGPLGFDLSNGLSARLGF